MVALVLGRLLGLERVDLLLEDALVEKLLGGRLLGIGAFEVCRRRCGCELGALQLEKSHRFAELDGVGGLEEQTLQCLGVLLLLLLLLLDYLKLEQLLLGLDASLEVCGCGHVALDSLE